MSERGGLECQSQNRLARLSRDEISGVGGMETQDAMSRFGGSGGRNVTLAVLAFVFGVSWAANCFGDTSMPTLALEYARDDAPDKLLVVGSRETSLGNTLRSIFQGMKGLNIAPAGSSSPSIS